MSETRAVLEVSVIVYDGTADEAAKALTGTLETFLTESGGEVEIVEARVAGHGQPVT
jgi:RNA binding exosome subunit